MVRSMLLLLLGFLWKNCCHHLFETKNLLDVRFRGLSHTCRTLSRTSRSAEEREGDQTSCVYPHYGAHVQQLAQCILFYGNAFVHVARLRIPPPTSRQQLRRLLLRSTIGMPRWPGNTPRPAMLQMLLQSMLKVERSVFATTGKAATNNMTVMGLCITGKLCQRTLRFTTASYADTVRAQEVLETYAFPGKRNMGYLFAYESKCHRVVASIKEDEKGQKQVTIPPFRRPLTLSTSTTTVSPTGKRPTIVSSMGYLEQVERFLSNMYVISPVLVGSASLDENNPKAIHMIPSCSSFQSFQ